MRRRAGNSGVFSGDDRWQSHADGRIGPAAEPQARITSRLIDSLYTEAMLLADEARSYFDDIGRDDRAGLEPFARVGFACESLKVTTRIMHIVAWLLTQRAIESGEIPLREGRRPERRLGHAQDSDEAVIVQLPRSRPALINASADLYARVKRHRRGARWKSTCRKARRGR